MGYTPSMTRTQEIIQQMRTLLDELTKLEEVPTTIPQRSGSVARKIKNLDANKYKGCMGGITYLLDHSFFNTPKSGKQVSDELKKEGWHYSGELISMNLLALTRKRTLTRLEDTSGRGWVYVIRK